METTKVRSTGTGYARAVLAAVLTVCAVVAVGVYAFAPEVLVAIRAKVGLAGPVVVAPTEDVAEVTADALDAPDATEEDGPAKRRSVIMVEAREGRAKPERQVRP